MDKLTLIASLLTALFTGGSFVFAIYRFLLSSKPAILYKSMGKQDACGKYIFWKIEIEIHPAQRQTTIRSIKTNHPDIYISINNSLNDWSFSNRGHELKLNKIIPPYFPRAAPIHLRLQILGPADVLNSPSFTVKPSLLNNQIIITA